MHALNNLISRPNAAMAGSYKPAFNSNGLAGSYHSSSSSALNGASPVGGARSSKAVAGRAMASALAAQLKQLMRQQQQHLQEQQQLEQLQVLMQQLPMPGAEALGSPNSAQHMQLLLEQEISNNMQQAALAAAAAEAANQRLNTLWYAMHAPGMLPAAAAAAGGFGPAAAAPSGSAGFSSSASPVVHGNGLFNSPAVCEPLTLGLDWNMQQQQQSLPMHFSPAHSNTLQGWMGPSGGSPVLHPLAAAASAYNHSSNSHISNAPAGLGFAGNDASSNEQALLAMLLSQMQGSGAAAAPGFSAGMHGMGAACGVSPHFPGSNTGASQAQAQAAAAALLAAAAAAHVAPGGTAGVPGGVMPSYTDGSMVAPLAMQQQQQGGVGGFFMP
jgi:hypothetical protein